MTFRIERTETFARWLRKLRDRDGIARINDRIARLRQGDFGDARSVGERVFELRIHAGPGYRVYFTRRGSAVIVLLCGGDKGSQRRDVEHAKRIAAGYRRR